jgi:hypothetical protein
MKDMYRLDFTRGKLDKIDSNIPPRGWQDSAGAGQETPPERRGYTFDTPESVGGDARQDEE